MRHVFLAAAKRGSILKAKAKRKAEASKVDSDDNRPSPKTRRDGPAPGTVGNGARELARETGMDRERAQRLVKIGNKVAEELLDAVAPFHPRHNATTYQCHHATPQAY